MKILKFGGSSLASPKTVNQVKDIVAGRFKKERLLLVLSAFQGITNQLIKAGELAASGDEAFEPTVLKLG